MQGRARSAIGRSVVVVFAALLPHAAMICHMEAICASLSGHLVRYNRPSSARPPGALFISEARRMKVRGARCVEAGSWFVN